MDLNEKEMQVRASSGFAWRHVNVAEGQPQLPPDPVVVLADMIDNDNVLSAAFDATVDVVTMNGYQFQGDNQRELKRIKKMFDDVLDFDQVLDNVLYQLFRGDSYLELVENNRGSMDEPPSDSVIPRFEVHPLESREMEIEFDEHGEVIQYWQKPRSSAREPVSFPRESVIHFRMKWVGSSPYSQNPLKSISRPLQTKRSGLVYLQSIFENFPPKLMYVLRNANKAQADAFMSQIRTAKIDPSRDIVAWGDADAKQTGVDLFQRGLVDILEYLRKEIAMITRIPPSWLGIREAGGRGQGETETLAFLSRVKKIQQKVASQINRELLPKLGFKNIKFVFNPVTLGDEKKSLEVAKMLKEMQLEDDDVLHYLHEKGIQIPSDASFKEFDNPFEAGNAGPNKDKDLMPSRQRMDKMNDDMTNNVDETGVSRDSDRKMEEQQVRSDLWTYPVETSGA